MPQYDATNGTGIFRLKVWEASQSIALNQTTIAWELHLYCFNNISYDYSNTVGYNVVINGVTVASGSYGYDFRGYTDALISSGTTTVTHNADGTKTISTTAHSNATGQAPGGPYDVGGSWALTTIPRATTPTVSPTSGDTGSLYTITHTPATSSFYHDIAYGFDGQAGSFTNIATNVAGTTTTTGWTPAHTLLPNDASKTATIRVITRSSSGGTIIGTKYVDLPLTVPTSVVPTISSVAWADGQVSSPDMPTLMGGASRFVQKWSKLKPTVTSAGAGGSSIVTSKVIQNGQETPSGTAFANPIELSGAAPFSAIVTDSRNRNNAAYASTVAVTAYNYPNLPVPTVVRTSDAAGLVPSPIGTYLAITPNASVSSLVFSASEKNLLEYQIRVRPVGGSYTTVQAWTATGVVMPTWTAKKVISGYASNTEYEVEVSIRDLFGKNAYRSSQTIVAQVVKVPAEFIFMDRDGNNGIGLLGYRRYGALDVHGDGYFDNLFQNTLAVVDFGDAATTSVSGISELATSAETITGTDTVRTTTPKGVFDGFTSWIAADRTDIDNLEARETFVRIVPTSMSVLSGSGSYDSFGKVTFSGATGVSLNGIFTTTFENYFMLINAGTVSTGSGLFVRFGTGTTDQATGYTGSYSEAAPSLAWSTPAVMSTDIRIGRVTGGGSVLETWLMSPFNSGNRTRTLSRSIDADAYLSQSGGSKTTASSHTRLSILTLGAATIGGTLEVYGVRG